MLRRAGMRKSVDASLELLISTLLVPTLLPLVTTIIYTWLLPTTSWSFIFVQLIIFTIRVIAQSWLVRFTIDNHVAAEVVEIALEIF